MNITVKTLEPEPTVLVGLANQKSQNIARSAIYIQENELRGNPMREDFEKNKTAIEVPSPVTVSVAKPKVKSKVVKLNVVKNLSHHLRMFEGSSATHIRMSEEV
ncbi:hypothetical protein SESBI_05561 [Sesbania bispinosa]|nr:hypothetical protein SESBI_05561 [Sesbania bispinosa]